jgi:UDP-glucuronate 4-epimerase
MAMFRFTRAILAGEPLDLYNHGQMVRDFTFVDDVAEPLVRLLDKPATPDPGFDASRPDPARSDAPFRVFNVGGGHPVQLLELIEALEDTLGRKAQRRLLPLQAGDVLATGAQTARLQDWIGPCAATPLRAGLRSFADWYLAYHAAAGAT